MQVAPGAADWLGHLPNSLPAEFVSECGLSLRREAGREAGPGGQMEGDHSGGVHLLLAKDWQQRDRWLAALRGVSQACAAAHQQGVHHRSGEGQHGGEGQGGLQGGRVLERVARARAANAGVVSSPAAIAPPLAPVQAV